MLLAGVSLLGGAHLFKWLSPKRAFVLLALTVSGAALATAFILIFDKPIPPNKLKSVEDSFTKADFSALPEKSKFIARDGAVLFYRHYPGATPNTIILIHGSSGTSASMHVLARTLQDRGANVYALSMRGHDNSGRSGDIDYVGQLEDDLADFIAKLSAKQPGERRSLLGFSSGASFVLRFAGTNYAKGLDHFILVAPILPRNAPTNRPYTKVGWTSAAVPRIVLLSILSGFGSHQFEGLPVLAFAVPPKLRKTQTTFYSFRMWKNFGTGADYARSLGSAPGKVSLVVGEKDEFVIPAEFDPLLKPIRRDLGITIVPKMGHTDLVLNPQALQGVASIALDQ
jgi:non-heme chloroperoxidase